MYRGHVRRRLSGQTMPRFLSRRNRHESKDASQLRRRLEIAPPNQCARHTGHTCPMKCRLALISWPKSLESLTPVGECRRIASHGTDTGLVEREWELSNRNSRMGQGCQSLKQPESFNSCASYWSFLPSFASFDIRRKYTFANASPSRRIVSILCPRTSNISGVPLRLL